LAAPGKAPQHRQGFGLLQGNRWGIWREEGRLIERDADEKKKRAHGKVVQKMKGEGGEELNTSANLERAGKRKLKKKNKAAKKRNLKEQGQR